VLQIGLINVLPHPKPVVQCDDGDALTSVVLENLGQITDGSPLYYRPTCGTLKYLLIKTYAVFLGHQLFWVVPFQTVKLWKSTVPHVHFSCVLQREREREREREALGFMVLLLMTHLLSC
jgi:hypothetical protein